MALDKEKANELSLPTSAERLEHQCSKSYLMAMLQDPPPENKYAISRPPPENKYVFSRPPLKPSTSQQVVTKPLQFESVLMGLSGDGKHLLLLPSNMKPKTQVPLLQPATSTETSAKNVSESEKDTKRPLDSKNSGEAKKARKSDEGELVSKKDKETEMGPRCNCRLSIISKKFHCNDFTEEDRKAMFTDFWKNNDWKQRKDLVCSLVKCGIPNARRRACTDPSRKEFAFQYNLKKNGELLRVCKVMFLTTLSVGDGTVRDWVMCGMSQNPFVNL